MAKLDLTKYGITCTTEIVYNPSYEQLFEEETKPGLEGYEKGQVISSESTFPEPTSAHCWPFRAEASTRPTPFV